MIRQGRGRRTAATIATIAAGLLAIPAAAQADSATLQVLDSAGKSDPVADVGRTFKTSGNSAAPREVYVKYRPAGGAACTPSADTDSGRTDSALPYGVDVNGDFTVTRTGTWDTPGSVQFCIWIADTATQSVTPISQVITFRAPAGAVSATVTPIDAPPGQVLTATITGTTEAPKELYAAYRAAGGAACATSYSTDSGRGVVNGRDINGGFSETTTFTPDAAGDYILCLWVADSGSDSAPTAGPQAIPFRVVAPPPPCLVPSITPGTPLASALQQLTTASCVAGKQRYQASDRYARGTLIKLLRPSGTSLPNGAPVDMLLSSGKPCRVPAARRGLRLAAARARLTAAGCTPGTVRRTRSRRAKGTVVRFSPASGVRLSPRSRVTIVLSRGR